MRPGLVHHGVAQQADSLDPTSHMLPGFIHSGGLRARSIPEGVPVTMRLPGESVIVSLRLATRVGDPAASSMGVGDEPHSVFLLGCEAGGLRTPHGRLVPDVRQEIPASVHAFLGERPVVVEPLALVAYQRAVQITRMPAD